MLFFHGSGSQRRVCSSGILIGNFDRFFGLYIMFASFDRVDLEGRVGEVLSIGLSRPRIVLLTLKKGV